MTKRKGGRWQERIRIGDKTVYIYGKTKTEVKRKIVEAMEKQSAGMQFRELADNWLRKHEGEIAATTMRGYLPAAKRAQNYFGETE